MWSYGFALCTFIYSLFIVDWLSRSFVELYDLCRCICECMLWARERIIMHSVNATGIVEDFVLLKKQNSLWFCQILGIQAK